jgi:membrane protease YdiL (CAAX protease family)
LPAVAGLSLLALLFWFVMFSPWTSGLANFWLEMTGASSLLALTALYVQRREWRQLFAFRWSYLVIGMLSAALLYGVFYLGNLAASALLSNAGSQVAGIYSPRAAASPWVIAILLFVVIGPAEELFWRNFIQRCLGERLPLWAAWLLAAGVYTLVHIWSFNLLLLAAAGVCGLFWGAMFLRYRSVWPGLISHALWDVAAFVLFPFHH